MKVKEIMNSEAVKTCTSETNLANVAQIMKEVNVGALPVVDRDNKVVGIVTDRDVCLSLAGKTGKNATEITVKEILPKTAIRTVKTDDNVTDALREMRKNRVGRLPVTDTEGKLKGIISVNNLLSNALEKKEDLGTTTGSEETLAKTIAALFDRNSSKTTTTRMEMEAGE